MRCLSQRQAEVLLVRFLHRGASRRALYRMTSTHSDPGTSLGGSRVADALGMPGEVQDLGPTRSPPGAADGHPSGSHSIDSVVSWNSDGATTGPTVNSANCLYTSTPNCWIGSHILVVGFVWNRAEA